MPEPSPIASIPEPPEKRLPGHFRYWFRVVIALMVAAALSYTIYQAVQDLGEVPFSLRQMAWGNLVAAVGLYALVMLLAAQFWFLLLHATGNHPVWSRAMMAFFSSQLGKYVPGKAMVVIVRTDMIQGAQVEPRTAAATVFAETLTWIFVGSAIACGLLFFELKGFPLLRWTAVGLVAMAGGLTWPPVFRRLAGRFVPVPELLRGINFRVMMVGWVVMGAGWLLNGVCLWLVVRAIPPTGLIESGFAWADYRLALACVTLATVAGFVSLLPGGLGVRELVMIPLLSGRFGMLSAVLAAILLRFVWLAAELGTSAIIYGYRRFILPSAE